MLPLSLLPSWLLVEVLPLLTVLLLLFFLAREHRCYNRVCHLAIDSYCCIRLFTVDCGWLLVNFNQLRLISRYGTNGTTCSIMVPSKSMVKNRSMMVPNGTKSPGVDHRKPGTMVPWYPNLWIYRSVRTALKILLFHLTSSEKTLKFSVFFS